MIAEIVGVGTELLLGQVVNTNARDISEALARIGIDVHHHTVVGDNLERMKAVLATALGRAEAVIVTGGLGPTPDDLTRQAVAELFGVPLVRRDDLAEQIRAVFFRLGRKMPEENLRQADLPEGATPIAPQGTAPGFYIERDGVLLCALPGVPWEMRAMLASTVLPLLQRRAGLATISSREVLVIGLGESRTHELIADLVAAQSNPTIAYLAGQGQVRVRLTAKAASESEALALIAPVEQEIRARLGDAAVPGNHSHIALALAEMLRRAGATVAAAESLTGGLIGVELTRYGGASEYFKGSLVVYATEAKAALAGIDEALLSGPGPVSEQCAAALAEAAAARFAADLGLSATGVAGPAEQDGRPVGTIYVGAHLGGRTEVRFVRGYGDRDHVRAVAATSAMDLGRRLLQSR